MKYVLVLNLCLFSLSCTGDEGPAGPTGPQGGQGIVGQPGASCIAVDNGDMSYTISCPNSMPFTVRSGKDGEPGTKGTDGQPGMNGTDGMDGQPGMAGPKGDPGKDGADGMDGQSCNIVDNGDGTLTIQCAQGPAYTINGMQEANGGGDLPGNENDQFQGDECSNGDLHGFCDNRDTNTQPCNGQYLMGLCPGPAPVQCCVDHPCATNNGQDGVCLNVAECATQAVPGFCPGGNAIQCCLNP